MDGMGMMMKALLSGMGLKPEDITENVTKIGATIEAFKKQQDEMNAKLDNIFSRLDVVGNGLMIVASHLSEGAKDQNPNTGNSDAPEKQRLEIEHLNGSGSGNGGDAPEE